MLLPFLHVKDTEVGELLAFFFFFFKCSFLLTFPWKMRSCQKNLIWHKIWTNGGIYLIMALTCVSSVGSLVWLVRTGLWTRCPFVNCANKDAMEPLRASHCPNRIITSAEMLPMVINWGLIALGRRDVHTQEFPRGVCLTLPCLHQTSRVPSSPKL